MNFILQHLQSATHRIVAACIVVHILVTAIFAGEPTGLELYAWSSEDFHVWQLISYMFLHAGWVHLGLNMLAFWSFGRVIEQVWGGRRVLVFFLICGVGSGLMHLAVNYYDYRQLVEHFIDAGVTDSDFAQILQRGLDISVNFDGISRSQVQNLWQMHHSSAVGASGALYGVLIAFALMFPNFKVMLLILPIPIAAKIFVPILLLIDLTAGLTGFSLFGYNIAHFAHLGGALTGLLMFYYWRMGVHQ